MPRSPKTLNAQLDAYSAAVKPLTADGTPRLANWSVYAMATGSALAMATSANAGIIYSGPLALSTSMPPVERITGHGFVNATLHLVTGPFAGANNVSLQLGGGRASGGTVFAQARIAGSVGVLGNGSFYVKQMAPGSVISGLKNFTGGSIWAATINNTGSYLGGTWANGVIGYAGLKLNGSGDFAWLKVSWSGADNFPDTINLYGWAVQTDGSAILAGDTGATPEPGTFGLALLAAGAAGVLAWRRRKQPAAE